MIALSRPLKEDRLDLTDDGPFSTFETRQGTLGHSRLIVALKK